MYVFMSFASPHTSKNLGCCIVEVEDPAQANQKCADLGLMPEECNHAKGFPMDEEGFQQQGMELNKLYTPEEMEAMGFIKKRERV